MLGYGFFVICTAGIFNENGNGRTDNHALVNSDTVAAYAVALSVKHGKSDGGVAYIVNNISSWIKIHYVACENRGKRCAKLNYGGSLRDLEGGGAHKVAAYGDGCCACVIVIFILQGAAVLGGVEGQAAVHFYRNVGGMGGVRIKDKFSGGINIHLYRRGSNSHIVVEKCIVMIWRANHRYDYLIFACILGRALKRRAVLHIANGHVLRVKSCGKVHAYVLRIEIIGEIKRVKAKAVLGEDCLSDREYSGSFACVIILADNRNYSIVAGINVIGIGYGVICRVNGSAVNVNVNCRSLLFTVIISVSNIYHTVL